MPAPERKTRLLERLAKVFGMLADAQYAIADGELDTAEALLDQLSDAESFVRRHASGAAETGGAS